MQEVEISTIETAHPEERSCFAEGFGQEAKLAFARHLAADLRSCPDRKGGKSALPEDMCGVRTVENYFFLSKRLSN